jgi:hypothetical protein
MRGLSLTKKIIKQKLVDRWNKCVKENGGYREIMLLRIIIVIVLFYEKLIADTF